MPVPGYEDYEVSDQGRVRSLTRSVRSRWGTPKALKGRVLRQCDQGKYLVVTLYRDRVPKMFTVHRLVLLAFVGPCPEGQEGLHFDDDGKNNRLENLRWGSHIENARDCKRNDGFARGRGTHCPNGHEYDETNSRVIYGVLYRYCPACTAVRESARSARRGLHPRARTQCPQGHAYDDNNTYIDKTGRRHCRSCGRKRALEYERKKRG